MSQLIDISQCGGKRRVLAHPPTPGQRVLQRLDRTGEAKKIVPPVDRCNRTLVGRSIASLSAKYGVLSREVGKKRVLAHPLCPGQVGIKRLDRRVAANKLVPPLQRLIRPLVDEIVPMKLCRCKLPLNLRPRNRTTLLSAVNFADNGTLAHRGFDMPELVSAKPGITAMVGRPVMRYTPAITGTGLIDVGQPLVGQKRPSRHHPEGATQARGGFTQKPQITNSCLSKSAVIAQATTTPPKEPLNNNAPNWSWAIKLIAGRSIQPIGCFDNQYGIFSRLKTDALTKVAERHILKMVLGQYVARSSRKLSQSSAKVSAGNKIKNSELSPLTADNHSQIPKALSMVDSLPSVCMRTWQSTPFNAVRAANEACHGNSLARESATIYGVIGGLNG